MARPVSSARRCRIDAARLTPPLRRLWRIPRMLAHLVRGLCTIWFVFPSLDAHARRARVRELVAAPAASDGHRHPDDGHARPSERAGRRESRVVARHLRAARAPVRCASSPRRRSRAGRCSDGSSAASARCSSSARAGTTRIASIRRSRSALDAGDMVAVFPEGTTTRRHERAAVQGLAAAADRRCGRCTCSPSRSAIATPDGDCARRRRRTSTTSRSSARSGACPASARLVVEHALRRSRLPAQRQASARARARGRRRYSVGAGVTVRAARHLVDAPVRQANRRKRAAPQAARVEHQHVGREHQIERRPVAADDERRAQSARFGCANHGAKPRGACAAPRFSRNSIVPSAVQKRSRVQRVDDDAQPIVAGEGVAPRVRLVAIERRAGNASRPALREHRLDFARDSATTSRPSTAAAAPACTISMPSLGDGERAAARASRAARRDRALRGSSRACRRDAASRWPAATVNRCRS